METPKSKKRVIVEQQVHIFPEPNDEKVRGMNNRSIADEWPSFDPKTAEALNIKIIPEKPLDPQDLSCP